MSHFLEIIDSKGLRNQAELGINDEDVRDVAAAASGQRGAGRIKVESFGMPGQSNG